MPLAPALRSSPDAWLSYHTTQCYWPRPPAELRSSAHVMSWAETHSRGQAFLITLWEHSCLRTWAAQVLKKHLDSRRACKVRAANEGKASGPRSGKMGTGSLLCISNDVSHGSGQELCFCQTLNDWQWTAELHSLELSPGFTEYYLCNLKQVT